MEYNIKEIEKTLTELTSGEMSKESSKLTASLSDSDVVMEHLQDFLILGTIKATETDEVERAMVSALGAAFQSGLEVGVRLGRDNGTN